jgi:hypothetical protein
MPDSFYYRQQAARFDRVADQCSVPELIPYYRRLAADYRRRVQTVSAAPVPQGQPEQIEFPD